MQGTQRSMHTLRTMIWLYTGCSWATHDNKVNGAHLGPTWVLSAPDGHHVGPINLVIRDIFKYCSIDTGEISSSANEKKPSIIWINITQIGKNL